MNRSRHLSVASLLMMLCLLAGCTFPGMIPEGHALPPVQPTPTATPLPALQLPFDEAPHQDLTEWWYYTGHLQGKDAQGQLHTYGFELTFFRISLNSLAVYSGQGGVTDISRGQYQAAQQTTGDPNAVLRNDASPPGSGFNLAVNTWKMQGLSGQDQLSFATADYAPTLALTSAKPGAVLHNNDGILSSSGLGATYYYSRTHMNVTGTVLDHGVPITVTGLAWMDHQWGNFLLGSSISWDWFSLQLDNDVEYMVFNVFDHAHDQRFVAATRVAPDGSATSLLSGIAEAALGQWTSPTTHITYPSQWLLALPGGSLTITPDLANQEFYVPDASTGVNATYWEGACSVTGTLDGQAVTGQAYTELTGRTTMP